MEKVEDKNEGDKTEKEKPNTTTLKSEPAEDSKEKIKDKKRSGEGGTLRRTQPCV